MGVHLREKPLKGSKKGISLYLDINEGGIRKFESLKIFIYKADPSDLKKQKMELGKKIHAQRLLELANGEFGFATRDNREINFITYCEVGMDRKGPKTKENWNSALNYLKEYAGSKLPIKKINKTWLEGYKKFLLEELSPNSASTYFAKVKKTLSEAMKDEIIQSNPATLVEPIKLTDSTTKYLDIEDVKAIAKVDFDNKEVQRAFLFSCFTGLRFSDVRSLTWDNIITKTINKEIRYFLTFNQTKTKSNNEIPLSSSAIDLLGKKRENLEFIFNISIHSGSVNRTLRRLLELAEITKRITFHSSRHTNATLLLTNGAEFLTVSKLLGHKDTKSTVRYAKVVDQLKLTAIDNLPNIKI
jgi:integrase